MKIFPVVVASLALFGCSSAQSPGRAAGRYEEKVTVDGVERTYILRVPKSYSPSKKTPLVVVYHGYTGSGAEAEIYTRFGEKAEAEGFIAVFPDGTGKPRGWNAGFMNLTGSAKSDEVKFTTQLLDQVEKEVSVDEDRVYFAGHSNGAMLSHYLASKLSTRVAAIGAVAGTIGIPTAATGLKVIPTPDSPVSVIIVHGRVDPIVGYARDSKSLMRGYGAEESAAWWAKVNGCNPAPEITKSANGNVVTESFGGGKGDSEVRFVTIENGVHDWPGGFHYLNGKPVEETKTGVKAVDLIWDFFKSHPKRK